MESTDKYFKRQILWAERIVNHIPQHDSQTAYVPQVFTTIRKWLRAPASYRKLLPPIFYVWQRFSTTSHRDDDSWLSLAIYFACVTFNIRDGIINSDETGTCRASIKIVHIDVFSCSVPSRLFSRHVYFCPTSKKGGGDQVRIFAFVNIFLYIKKNVCSVWHDKKHVTFRVS